MESLGVEASISCSIMFDPKKWCFLSQLVLNINFIIISAWNRLSPVIGLESLLPIYGMCFQTLNSLGPYGVKHD